MNNVTSAITSNCTDSLTLTDLTLVTYDHTQHSEELRGEAALCAWEYFLSDGFDDQGRGAVELRHCMMYMAPSILLVYDTLLLIEADLPCYDWLVVPAIMDSLVPYLQCFLNAGMYMVIQQTLAYKLAAQTALHPRLHV